METQIQDPEKLAQFREREDVQDIKISEDPNLAPFPERKNVQDIKITDDLEVATFPAGKNGQNMIFFKDSELAPFPQRKDDGQDIKLSDEHEKFSFACLEILKTKHKEGVEAYAPVLTQYMRECQQDWKAQTYSKKSFEIRWKSLLHAAKGFDPRLRCFSESEFTHFPALLILKQQGKKDEFAHYMLRYRIEEASGTNQEKQQLIHEIERKRHANMHKTNKEED